MTVTNTGVSFAWVSHTQRLINKKQTNKQKVTFSDAKIENIHLTFTWGRYLEAVNTYMILKRVFSTTSK